MKWSDGSQRRVRLAPGDRVMFRWRKSEAEVVRRLGEGANGSVYMVRIAGIGACAMKVGNDPFALQSEINALQSVGGEAPELLFSDDGLCRGEQFPLYIMAYVPGVPLSAAALAGRTERLLAVGASLLERLCMLHAAGWAFGDMKPDNVMIGPGDAVRLVDYGGATPFGHSVRQFTELYDRGTWRLGGRRADAAYDLFGFAAVMLEAAGLGGRMRALASSAAPGKGERLIALIGESGFPPAAAAELRRLLQGRYADSREALNGWRRAASEPVRVPPPAANERWPQIWLAGAIAAFAAVLWWMNGP